MQANLSHEIFARFFVWFLKRKSLLAGILELKRTQNTARRSRRSMPSTSSVPSMRCVIDGVRVGLGKDTIWLPRSLEVCFPLEHLKRRGGVHIPAKLPPAVQLCAEWRSVLQVSCLSHSYVHRSSQLQPN